MENEKNCPVCLESLETQINVRIPCQGKFGHHLCLKCFIHLQKKECPLCRTNFEALLPRIKERIKISLVEFLNHYVEPDEQPDSNA